LFKKNSCREKFCPEKFCPNPLKGRKILKAVQIDSNTQIFTHQASIHDPPTAESMANVTFEFDVRLPFGNQSQLGLVAMLGWNRGKTTYC
jgi:hypothetical protein